MINLNDAIGRTEGAHRTALQWFRDHTGSEVSWASMQAYSESEIRIVNQAKGIYKPAGSENALSVRQTLNGPYADRPVVRRDDGTWQYPYYQENPNPADRDKEATNRGLVRCMQDGIPVGVLIQKTPKPGVRYDVLGLALVADWQDGYFILEGFSPAGVARSADDSNAPGARDIYEQFADDGTDFDPHDIFDERERRVAEVVQRRGQGEFRRRLIEAYDGCCAVTGYDAIDALDAAHISPYRGTKSNDPRNGLLLRSDIHSLFDLGLVAIDIQTMTIVLSTRLSNTKYGHLAGQPIRMPTDETERPSIDALAAHRSWAKI